MKVFIFRGFPDKLQMVFEKGEYSVRYLDVFMSIDIESGIQQHSLLLFISTLAQPWKRCILDSW